MMAFKPLRVIPIEKYRIDIFHVKLNSYAEESFLELLSEDEKLRASRFMNEDDCFQFCARRAFLRTILSAYTLCPPKTLQFKYNPFGKPYLADYPHIKFSLSHSDDIALYAISHTAEIGIDIENMKNSGLEPNEIASLYFNADEKKEFEKESRESFIRIWTRKEAMLKVYGCGLSKPTLPLPKGWFTSSFTSANDYMASVCSSETIHQINHYFLLSKPS